VLLLIINNNLYLDKIQINQMIAHLQGKLVEKTPTHVIIDCGIGYHVNISLHTYSLLQMAILSNCSLTFK
jgi:ABC-type uncharacterized transport system permease subunit